MPESSYICLFFIKKSKYQIAQPLGRGKRMKKLWLPGSILIILLLMLVSVMITSEPGFGKKLRSDESHDQTISDIQTVADASTPITIKLTQSKIPLVNEEAKLHCRNQQHF